MRGIIWAMGAATLATAAAPPPPAERTVTGDGIVVARLGETPLRLRIDPAATAMPLISTDRAQAAGLKPGMFGIRYMVGPTRVDGRTAVATIDLGGGARIKRRVGWTDRAYAEGIDGAIGPGGLDEPVVRFVLRPVRPGERSVTFPILDQGGMMAGWGERFARIEVGGEPMRLRFDPHQRRTLATAGAATRLARSHGGTLSGAAEPVTIAFGIARPVRSMTLATPLTIGALSIARIGVRTGDFGRSGTIPEEGADPDEVVVTGKGARRNPSRDRLSLGADDLSRCSSIVFDRPAKRITLTCG